MVRYLIALLEIGWLEFHRLTFRFTRRFCQRRFYLFICFQDYDSYHPNPDLDYDRKGSGCWATPAITTSPLAKCRLLVSRRRRSRWDVAELVQDIVVIIYRSKSPVHLCQIFAYGGTVLGLYMSWGNWSLTAALRTFAQGSISSEYQISTIAHPFDTLITGMVADDY